MSTPSASARRPSRARTAVSAAGSMVENLKEPDPPAGRSHVVEADRPVPGPAVTPRWSPLCTATRAEWRRPAHRAFPGAAPAIDGQRHHVGRAGSKAADLVVAAIGVRPDTGSEAWRSRMWRGRRRRPPAARATRDIFAVETRSRSATPSVTPLTKSRPPATRPTGRDRSRGGCHHRDAATSQPVCSPMAIVGASTVPSPDRLEREAPRRRGPPVCRHHPNR